MKQKAVIFDLDGTLCELKDESEKHNHNGKEKPNYNMVEELEKEWYPLDVEIIILTGRKDKFRDITKKWFIDNQIWYDSLIMQEGSTAKKNEVFKEEKLKELMEEYDIQMVYDDNYKLWEVCQKLGIPFTPCY